MTKQKISTKRILLRTQFYIVALFFVFVFAILLFTFYSPNYYEHESPYRVDIKRGESLTNVIDTLYEHKIIPSKFKMKIISFVYGAEKNVKAGRYDIPNGLSYVKLVELLVNGSPTEQVSVTLPEGIWQSEIAQILKEKLNIDSSRVIGLSTSRSFINSLDLNTKSLEGYLLPETYYFYPNSTAEEILRKLKLQMDKVFNPEIEKRMAELKMTKHQILTLASIIDGESNLVSEFKTISGVYHNRLKIGMALQADPTVQYLIRDKHKNKILKKDLSIDSKFNTYKYTGFPPAPISNPGKDAIMAALYPEKHNYLFFVANGSGGHSFTHSSYEHEQNVMKYRQWRKTQNQ
ncbi:MAG: endolytic transglycosylase MltG [Melioribacteraceae bacterium]